MTEPRCKDCHFAVPLVDDGKVSIETAFCYRLPPTVVPPNSSTYPPVAMQTFWCGEFVITSRAIEKQATPTRKKAK